MSAPSSWVTRGGVQVHRSREPVNPVAARAALESALDERRGLLLSGGCDQPGRYRRGDLGYVDPPLEITACGRSITARALNARGLVLLPVVAAAWRGLLLPDAGAADAVTGTVPAATTAFAEEERTRQPSVFSALRAVVDSFAGTGDPLLGLYGAFGYDLVCQFEPIELHQARAAGDRDLVLHLPDTLLEIDPGRGTAVRHRYEFGFGGASTCGLRRGTEPVPYQVAPEPAVRDDHGPGEYAALVRLARDRFAAGDLFEVVPGQSFHRRCTAPPSVLFRRLRRDNPAPYGLLANLGAGEYLVGASPEMFVRVGPAPGGGGRLLVESCPISGTIARGADALADADQIRRLLNSDKDTAELTMCTDVDRNDKARVCQPGSVRVIGRRQVEMYATLIHTVDHVTGLLRRDRDAVDGFLAQLWAVTVTGAPKRAAIQFLERHERSPRRWYGGAVGRIGFDGSLDTALTLRTIQIRDGLATVRVGATLLYDSDPEAEEGETRLKARALLRALEPEPARPAPARSGVAARAGAGIRVLLVDHHDSFVHMLADYLRQTGAEVATFRSGFPSRLLDSLRPGLLVLSPGPGRPEDFDIARTLTLAWRRGIPVFGVCLGLQGIVQQLGGTLRVLAEPVHGKSSRVELVDGGGVVLAGLPPAFQVGRYHSLYADPATLPAELAVTARTADGLVMAVEHRTRPLGAVQFHPESIMSQQDQCGLRVISNVVSRLARRTRPPGAHHPSVPEEGGNACPSRPRLAERMSSTS
jgi:anthranilate synthase